MKTETDFRLIMNHSEASESLTKLGLSPGHIISLGSGVALGLHLLPITDFDTDVFAKQNYARTDGKRLNCISAYARHLNSVAFTGRIEDTSYALVDAGQIARMVCLCDRLSPAIETVREKKPSIQLARDSKLVRLMRRFETPIWSDANVIAQGFPDIFSQNNSLGGYAVLHDLVRLTWIHEWAHIILGHSGIWAMAHETAGLDEYSNEREALLGEKIEGISWSHALQNFELRADEQAIQYVAKQILYGRDLVGEMIGPSVDLISRLSVLGAACAVFAIDTLMVQGKVDPNNTTHPSASLRYMTMLQVIQQMALEYDPQLSFNVRAMTYNLINDLTTLNGDFHELLSVTPMIAETPDYKYYCEVQDYLMDDVGQKLAGALDHFAYAPQPTTSYQSA